MLLVILILLELLNQATSEWCQDKHSNWVILFMFSVTASNPVVLQLLVNNYDPTYYIFILGRIGGTDNVSLFLLISMMVVLLLMMVIIIFKQRLCMGGSNSINVNKLNK